MADCNAGMVAERALWVGAAVVTLSTFMMPRRTLFFLITLVLALHALVLAGASTQNVRAATAAAPQVFETRTVALAAPQPAAAPSPAARAKAAATPVPNTPRTPRARKPRPRQKPRVIVAAAPEPALPTDLPAANDPPNTADLRATEAIADAPEAPDGAAADLPNGAESNPGGPGGPAAPGAGTLVAEASTSSVSPSAAAKAPVPPDEAHANAPVQLPPPTRLEFEVTGRAKGFGYHASAELLWQHDATSYSAHQEIKVIFLGSRSQDSVGSVTAHGLQPRRFADRARSERTALFDFASGRVTFSANTPAAPIAPGAQDRLSVFLQLGSLLAAAPERYPAGTQLAMTTVSARAADVWTFTVEGDQTLDLPIGALRAVQLQRMPRRADDQKAQVWLAPNLGYLPVRIRLTEANGDFAELNLKSHEAP